MSELYYPNEDRWAERNAIVARYIPAGSSVIDLGAGYGGLARMLPRGCSYSGVDLPEFDMNRGRWPDGRWDVAVMSGVLEYARFPAAVFRHLRELAPLAIVTYSHGGRRREPTWISDLGVDQFRELAAKAGWTAAEVDTWTHRKLRPQTIWRLA